MKLERNRYYLRLTITDEELTQLDTSRMALMTLLTAKGFDINKPFITERLWHKQTTIIDQKLKHTLQDSIKISHHKLK